MSPKLPIGVDTKYKVPDCTDTRTALGCLGAGLLAGFVASGFGFFTRQTCHCGDKMATKILGIDPGLQRTGWGVIAVEGSRISFIAADMIKTDAKADTSMRLLTIAAALRDVIAAHTPQVAAVEETFVNKNAASSLALGQARGIALLIPAEAGLPVHEFAANLIKKTVTGIGHAEKQQIQAMIKILLPTAPAMAADAADALAVAICAAQHQCFK